MRDDGKTYADPKRVTAKEVPGQSAERREQEGRHRWHHNSSNSQRGVHDGNGRKKSDLLCPLPEMSGGGRGSTETDMRMSLSYQLLSFLGCNFGDVP